MTDGRVADERQPALLNAEITADRVRKVAADLRRVPSYAGFHDEVQLVLAAFAGSLDRRDSAPASDTVRDLRDAAGAASSLSVVAGDDWDQTSVAVWAFADSLSAASSGDPVAQEAVARMLGMERHPSSYWFRWPALPSEPKESP